ncbi:YARHG domain-containing protein [Dorea formicigenerans]|uniref:YARHG domain-containing protein n=1 Tax=Dorea formicigenerans TaxID=39486 RepID=UPI00156E9F42|nr:YARHG domain-containing protein [Dorea formicigenerans]NSK19484.1 YARHG domain-containing protein [Dorea formicigenerans]
MFCEKCGAELKEDWKICPNCGTPVPEENDEPIQAPNNNHKNNKWIIIGIVAVIIVVVVAAFTVFGKKETKSKVPKESKKTETEETDFSKQDLEDLIGKTAEDVKKTGLVEMGDSGEFEGLSGSITVRIEDGQVNYIAITGDKAKAPTFHGVSLGMTEEEANSKLADTYSQASNQTDNIRVYNSDKKASVYLGFTNGKVDSITYRPMEDTEAQNDQAQEYIFPDSDKKYLSEDEVRSVDESQLSLGRNEIFARHGYIFNDDSINQYFKGKSWYQGTVPADQFDMDSVFNDFEKKNVELIKKVENEVNGTSSQANNAEQQEAIQDTYDALIGVWYQYKDSEMAISFRNSNTLEVQYGGEQENKFFNYTVTARYEVYRYGEKKWCPIVIVDGTEYYFTDYVNGSIDLSGDGELDGYYDMIDSY